MTSPYLTAMVVGEHATDLRGRANQSRLAALIRCCRPSAWVRAFQRGTEALDRLRHAVGSGPRAAAKCCA